MDRVTVEGSDPSTLAPDGTARPAPADRSGALDLSITPPALIALVLVLAAAVALPHLLDPYRLQVVITIAMFAALAVSWDIVARTGQLSLAHAGFFGLGAYTVGLAYQNWGLPAMAGLALATIVALVVAFVLGVVTLRLRGIYFAIATLAFAEVLRTFVLQERDLTGGPVGVSMPPLWGGDRVATYYTVLGVLLLAVACSQLVARSRLDYAFAAIRTNERVAAVIGVDVVRYKVFAFTLSSGLAGLVGGFYLPFITHTDPNDAFNLGISVQALVMPIFGGLYTTLGPLVGTIVLKVVEEYLRVTIKQGHQIVFGLILIVAVLFMPGGLVGVYRRWRTSKSRG